MATQTLYALFPTVLDAERAIGALTDHGIRPENIGVIARTPAEDIAAPRVRSAYRRIVDEPVDVANAPVVTYAASENVAPAAYVHSTITPADSSDTRENVEAVGKTGITTTTAADAGAGAAIGTGVGLVAGIVATALAVTGVGLVGGLLAAAIAATVATTAAGAVVGGVAGYLSDMGMPQPAAEVLADRVREGDYLISVVIDMNQFDEVDQILNKYNAVGVDDAATFQNRAVTAALNPDADAGILTPGSIAEPVPDYPVARGPHMNSVPAVVGEPEQDIRRDLTGTPIERQGLYQTGTPSFGTGQVAAEPVLTPVSGALPSDAGPVGGVLASDASRAGYILPSDSERELEAEDEAVARRHAVV